MNNNDHNLTFGVRLLRFLGDLYPEIGQTNQITQEEFEYLCIEACDEIKRKYDDPSNEWYFKNISKDSKNYKDFIEKSFDSKFISFLKISKLL